MRGEDAAEIVLNYMIENVDTLEQKAKESMGGDVAGEVLIATEDMVLPDGVKVGDTFTVDKLPAYRLFIKSKKDMLNPSVMRIMYQGNVAWEVTFSAQSSWGEYDEVFNPCFTAYVDVQRGEILEITATDGGEKNRISQESDKGR